ncbi:MAG: T9SS C-terminal target domain-containing protein [Bacteroidetes bacterium]|nr:T9SS C-terminal target domain-containing protein [Bacteroidota bacterium]
MNRFYFLFILLFLAGASFAQPNFHFELEPIEIDQLGGLQSYAFTQHEGKWLIIGGRLDGLHRRQPWATFDEAGNNTNLIVVDPVSKQKWEASTDQLPAVIAQQLSSTNLQYEEQGAYLYLLGGYGFSNLAGDHITYPNLTAVDIEGTIQAIINGQDLNPFFRQITDQKMAVTGGVLLRMDDIFYLIGGQRFDGAYNPMDHPTFTQTYTEAVRRFTINDDGQNISINHLPEWNDPENLHRRDLNVLPQILPDGTEGITAFSGVFKEPNDLPFLDCVNITEAGYAVQDDFLQYFNHYHCAHIPLFSESDNAMHSVFFGGMAQYFMQNGVLMQDDNVPFVKTIAGVSRLADGSMAEYLFPNEMPGLLGSGAEFIVADDIPAFANDVIKMDDLPDNSIIGYIYGGINSSAENIFWINDGTQSTASSQIYQVRFMREETSSLYDPANYQSGKMAASIHPNPNTGTFQITLHLGYKSPINLQATDLAGKPLYEAVYPSGNLILGNNLLEVKLPDSLAAQVIVIKLESKREQLSKKVIIE